MLYAKCHVSYWPGLANRVRLIPHRARSGVSTVNTRCKSEDRRGPRVRRVSSKRDDRRGIAHVRVTGPTDWKATRWGGAAREPTARRLCELPYPYSSCTVMKVDLAACTGLHAWRQPEGPAA
jgi:hypothetical protein